MPINYRSVLNFDETALTIQLDDMRTKYFRDCYEDDSFASEEGFGEYVDTYPKGENE